MPLTDTLAPFAEYGMHYLSRVRIYKNGKSAVRTFILSTRAVYIEEVCLVALKNGGLRGS